VEKLISDKDQNKQRAAAELLAGVLGGLPLHPLLEDFSHAGGSRFEALAWKEAGVIVGLVHPPYEEDLFTEYQNGHVAYLGIIC
jgi:hypothetical protein